MMTRLPRPLSLILLGMLSTALFVAVKTPIAHAQYSVTIWAWDSVHGWLAEPITMDGVATGYTTPHTFTDLYGIHDFTARLTNDHGTRFSKWADDPVGRIDLTIVVAPDVNATYTAQYNATPYDVTIRAWDAVNGDLNEPITKDFIFTGYNTPHTFTGLTGIHWFRTPDTSTWGEGFLGWQGYPDQTLAVCAGGTYTAEYAAPPYDVTIWGWNSVQGWQAVPITMNGVPTGYSTPHTFTGLDGPTTFTVPNIDAHDTQFTRWNTGETSRSLTVTSGGTFTAEYYVWWIETVDASSADVGRGSSIALDFLGTPHVAYVDYASDALKYASRTGATGGVGIWTPETVAPAPANVRHNTASLAIDAGDTPHISYSNGDLIYATKAGSAWIPQTVDTADAQDGRWCALKLASLAADGYPHICYVAETGDIKVKYTTWTGTGWATTYLATSGYTGYQFTSLALDSQNHPHACWFHSGGGFTSPTVFYATKTDDTWSTPVAVASGLTATSGYCTIAVDPWDRPLIAYYDEYFDPYTSKGSLKLARWTGTAWDIETVDAPTLPTQDWVGLYPCLVTDYMGRPHISYYETWWTGSTTAGILKYAWDTGQSWVIETVDSTWNVGKWSSLAVNDDGTVHISYYDTTNARLKYARRSPLPSFDADEYFFQVLYDPLDPDGDGLNNALRVTMDVDSTYPGPQKITVLAVLLDPGDTGCYWALAAWIITDAAYDYGEITLFAPAMAAPGWYDISLVLYDDAGHIEQQLTDTDVAYLYAPARIYIRANGSIDPPTANITTTDHHLYTFTGPNTRAIVIERDNIILDGKGFTLQGTSAYQSRGIDLTSRTNVTIHNLRITGFDCGLWLNNTWNAHVYHNDFLDNAQHVHKTAAGYMNHTWDNGYPSGGNYWSGHPSTDLYKGPLQNQAGRDGVTDEIYIIDPNDADWYPLATAFSGPKGDMDGDRDVDIFDIVTMAGAYQAEYPDPRYNRLCDLDLDGDIDIFDVVAAAGNYNTKW